jgi:cobalt-zinc-cadmium efflux system outer membrane protein
LLYYTALKEKLLVDVSEDTYLRMKELATADSIRLHSGTIMEVDSRQSSVEARIQKNEVIRAQANWQVALVQMSRISGSTNPADASQPDGSLEVQIREFSLPWLTDQARKNHCDLQVAIQKQLISEKTLALIQAGRSTEIGLSTSLAYSSYAQNNIAPSPAHYTYNAGIAIPLKFSNLNKGELEASRLAIEQSKLNYRDAELEIIAQVNQAYIQYESQKRQLEEFHSGLLTESETILNSKIYSYKRGETSFLDVLNAQRTYNEIRKSFYETHYEYLAALIELERSAGIWDIQ